MKITDDCTHDKINAKSPSGKKKRFQLLWFWATLVVFVAGGGGCGCVVPTEAFCSSPPSKRRTMIGAPITTTITSKSSSYLCCICINCQWVTNCKAYHFVEAKHEQPHINVTPTFEPRDGSPTINVHIRSGAVAAASQPPLPFSTSRVTQKPVDKVANKDDDGESKPYYDDNIPFVTYEYDVVKCADFALEQDAWIRNMPEEIRKANPHFVPP